MRQGTGRFGNKVDVSSPKRIRYGDESHLTNALALIIEGQRGVERIHIPFATQQYRYK